MQQTATNPQTGEKIVWNGSQWVPAGQPASPAVQYIPPNPNSPKAQERAMDMSYKAQDQQFKAEDQAMQRQTNDLAERKFAYQQQRDAAKGENGGLDNDKRAMLNSAVTQLKEVERLYNANLKDEAFGILSSIAEYFPSDDNAAFNTAAAGLSEIGRAAFRVPGQGSQSDFEAKEFAAANKPASGDRDVAIEGKIATMKNRIESILQAYGEPSPWAEQSGPRMFAEGQDQVQAADGVKSESDPRLAGANDLVSSMLANGASNGPILNALRQQFGMTNQALGDINAQLNAYRKAVANSPNAPLPKVDLERIERPMGAVEQVISDAAASPLGSAAINAGNALAFNTYDNIGGQEVANSLALSNELNPTASTLGSIAGTVGGMVAGEGLLGAAGMAQGGLRSLIADGAFGAAAGAGADEDGNRLDGMVNGGLMALGGNLAGQGLARAAGNVLSPSGRGAEELYSQGVRPTPGQRAMATEGQGGIREMAGRVINAAEEGFGSVPFVGQSVRNARAEAVDQFQVGAFNKSLGELEGIQGVKSALPSPKMPATARHKFTQEQFDKGYDMARSNMKVVNDADLAADMQNVGQAVSSLSEQSQRRFANIYKQTVAPRAKGGQMSGDEYKKVVSDIGKVVRGIRKNQSGDGELADALDDFVSALDGAARRHSPKEAVEMMDKLDRGYAKFVIIEDAARRVGGEAGEFTPKAFERAVQNSGSRVRSKAYLQGEGLMQEYAKEGRALVDRIPDSGSAERVALVAGTTGLAGGATYMEPETLGPIGAIALAYSPVGRKILTGSIAPRPSGKLNALAQGARNAAPAIGTGGAALALPSD